MTTKRWAAMAFRLIYMNCMFMPNGKNKEKMLDFLLSAPPEVKSEYWKVLNER